jgi:hypothetical protein
MTFIPLLVVGILFLIGVGLLMCLPLVAVVVEEEQVLLVGTAEAVAAVSFKLRFI